MQDLDGRCGSAAPEPQFLARGSRSPTSRDLRWSTRSGMWGCKGLGSRALNKQSNLLNWLRSTRTGGMLGWLHHQKKLELEWSLWAIWRKAISMWSLCLLCWLATLRWFRRWHWLRCSMIGWSGPLQWAPWLSRGTLGSTQLKKWREALHQGLQSTRSRWEIALRGNWIWGPSLKANQALPRESKPVPRTSSLQRACY